MDLNAVQMFVTVVQAGSLSSAAERLNIPLPTLSRRVRELERQLSVQLLERSARGTKLTEAGIRLYEHANRGIELLVEGEQAVVSDQALLKGRLRLSLPQTFEPWWEVLSIFQQHYPNVRLHVYTTERRVDLIEDGIDVALRVGSIAHDALVARRMLSYRHVLVASPKLVAKLGTPKSPDDLHRYPCAIWGFGGISNGRWRLGEHDIQPDAVLSANDYAHLRHCAIAAEVVTELPPFLAAQCIRAGQLVPLLPTHPFPEQQVSLLYPSHRHPSAIVRTYLDFCQSRTSWFAEACKTPQGFHA
nr:LysR family transcriptional regulator [uncultured Cupriavidus sp.]